MIAVVIFLLSVFGVLCDLPVHCEWDQIKGDWNFALSDEKYGKEAMGTCSESTFTSTSTLRISLTEPNIVTNLDNGLTGWFTLIYDQGVEVNLEGKKYFAFFYYTESDGPFGNVTSYCDRTFVGWFHDSVPNARKWGCYMGSKKSGSSVSIQYHQYPKSWYYGMMDKFYDVDDVDSYSSYLGAPMLQFRVDYLQKYHQYMSQKYPIKVDISDLPKEFDWRNINGTDFVNPVRDQEQCGSCFAFASTGMLSARTRIYSGMKDLTVYSPQEVLDCSLYAQGCKGGFSYLVAGKYAEDYGLVSEECYPYEGHDDKCRPLCAGQKRQYAGYYQYVGGYYGGVTAEGMMREVYDNGPIAVAFLVEQSLRSYTHGVYHCPKNDAPPPPHFVVTNHAVQVVGWGEDNGEPYWIVKNSWGNWGNKGYFWMQRGTDSCAIETAAFHSVPFVF